MRKILISFLGRSPKTESGYRTTSYIFNNQTLEPAAYAGYVLHKLVKPNKLVILGTAGSMWDHLFEVDLALADEAEDERLELIDSVANQTTTQAQLTSLAPLLANSLGCEVKLVIIPSETELPAQLEILQTIAENTAGANELALDVTHGFRYLPMLAYAAALYLQTVQPNLNVSHIYYGEFNPDTQQGKIHDLAGLLEINSWNKAILYSEATGNYAELANLINNPQVAQQLTQASYLESIHQGAQARGVIRNLRSQLEQEPLTGPGALYQPALLASTEWVNESRLYLRQSAQAWRSLQRKDYLRAALYGFEAYITKQVQQDTNLGTQAVDSYDARREKQDEITADRSFRKTAQGKAFILLRNLRNSLAHGEQNSMKAIQQAMSSAEDLNQALTNCFELLLAD